MQSPLPTMPPHDFAAEEAVLGSILIDSGNYARVAPFLKAEHFLAEKNRYVFGAMVTLSERRNELDAVTVAHQLFEDERLEGVGGMAFLSHLVMVTPTSLHCVHYAAIVHQCARARAGIAIIATAADALFAKPSEVDETLRNLATSASNIYDDAPGKPQKNARELFDEILEEMTEMDNPLKKVSTGFRYLDRMFSGGLTPEELIIIGGRPGGGKSVIAMQLAEMAIRQDKRVLAFTMEMDGKRVLRRALSAGVQMATGDLDDTVRYDRADATSIIDKIGEYSDWGDRLVIDESASPTIEYIRNEVMAHAAAGHCPDMLIVDHIQLINSANSDNRTTRNTELDKITAQLKAIAREHKLVVIATSQLNRAAVNRDGKPPTMSELRDSGTIEQNADIVLLLHEPKNDGNTNFKVKSQFIVAKNRGGQIGNVGVWFEKAYSRFEEA